MAANLNEAELERARREAIARLEKDRAVKAAALAEADTKLQQARDGDLKARLGTRRRSEMTMKERAELVVEGRLARVPEPGLVTSDGRPVRRRATGAATSSC